MSRLTKSEVARRQLGTAMSLFLSGSDPVSVHTLACAGGEIAEGLVKAKQEAPYLHYMIQSTGLPEKEIKRIRHKYYNSFKHHSDKSHKKARDDADTIAQFSNDENESALFVGWNDYAFAGFPLPVEVQVFQIWIYSKVPRSNPHIGFAAAGNDLFPNLSGMQLAQQFSELRTACDVARKEENLISNPLTDPRPLML